MSFYQSLEINDKFIHSRETNPGTYTIEDYIGKEATTHSLLTDILSTCQSYLEEENINIFELLEILEAAKTTIHQSILVEGFNANNSSSNNYNEQPTDEELEELALTEALDEFFDENNNNN